MSFRTGDIRDSIHEPYASAELSGIQLVGAQLPPFGRGELLTVGR
jgi:hypothetical protein